MADEFMNAETIDKIIDISKPDYHTTKLGANGPEIVFSNKQMYKIDDQPPLPPQLPVQTLQSLVDVTTQKVQDDLENENVLVHVISPTRVEIIAREYDEYRRRPVYVIAQMPELERRFPFGNWLKQEDFIIGLQACFVESEDCSEIIKLASSLASEERLNVEDTGLSQQVTAKSGISLQQTIPVRPRRRLTPYRTFREADQVESTFILRIKKGNDGFPLLALFEADGGAWRSIAIHNVAEWMRANLPDGYLVIE
jgi:hypothetical protein